LIKNSAPIELLSRVEAELTKFIGTADQFDNITLLSIKKMAHGQTCVISQTLLTRTLVPRQRGVTQTGRIIETASTGQ
jgi:hypothetical protein